jgi:hypothetical protein
MSKYRSQCNGGWKKSRMDITTRCCDEKDQIAADVPVGVSLAFCLWFFSSHNPSRPNLIASTKPSCPH